MKLLRKRTVAFIIMIFLITGAILLGSYRSLSKLYNDTTSLFYDDSLNQTRSIQTLLNERLSVSYNMVNLGKKYYSASEDSIRSVSNAREFLIQAGSPTQKYLANTQLNGAVDELYFKLLNTKMNNSDKNDVTAYYGQFNDYNEEITLNKYNEYSTNFNTRIKKIPTSFFASLWSLGEIELYR